MRKPIRTGTGGEGVEIAFEAIAKRLVGGIGDRPGLNANLLK
ncbi:hypothetical protein [Caulobacter sp. S45]|nr:hypothetical protein [Caulobacter sp. S45]